MIMFYHPWVMDATLCIVCCYLLIVDLGNNNNNNLDIWNGKRKLTQDWAVERNDGGKGSKIPIIINIDTNDSQSNELTTCKN